MVIQFWTHLADVLPLIGEYRYYNFPVGGSQSRNIHNCDDLLGSYGDAKWAIIDLLNREYSALLPEPFDLYNWLHNRQDEVAHFLNEAGSNVLSYSELGIPHKIETWVGKKGFILGMAQQGKGFNAGQIIHEKLKTKLKINGGAAFTFYENCRSAIFFDDPEDARIVYMLAMIA